MKIMTFARAALVAVALAAALPASAANLYVSNAASNGYGLGNDTTGTGSLAAPYLTVDKANTAATNGDVVILNPSGTCYAENSSANNYLIVSKTLTIQTDPALVAAQGKACIRGTAASRIVNITAATTVWNDLVLDANTASKSNAVVVGQAGANATFNRVDIKGLTGSGYAFAQAASTAWVWDKVSMTTANGNASTTNFVSIANAGVSLTFKGITWNGIAGGALAAAHNTTTLIRFAPSADGTRNTITDVAQPIYFPNGAVQTLIDVQSCDFSGAITQAIWGQNNATEAVTQLTVKYNSFSGSITGVQTFGATGSYGNVEIAYNRYVGPLSLINSSATGFTGSVHHNTIVQTSATQDPINIKAASGQVLVYANTITTDIGAGSNSGHAIAIGLDGQGTFASNTAAATGVLKLGDTSGHAYVYQPVAIPFVALSAIPSSFSLKLSKVGAPTGAVTAYLYSNNAGVPGAVLDTSDLSGITLGTFDAASLTSTPTWFQFWLPSHVTVTASTYHLVLRFAGAPSASNYVAIEANAAGTVGGGSADGASWSAGALQALHQFQFANFEIVDPKAYDNVVTITTTTATGVHDIFIGGTVGGQMYRNQTYGGSIGLIFKLTDGSNPAHPALAYDNLVFQGNSTNTGRQLLRDKGSRGVAWYHNTAVMNGNGDSGVIVVDNDYDATNVPQYSGQPSQNAVVKNNILVGQAAGSAAYIYALGSANGAVGGVKVINPVIDFNLFAFGTNLKPMRDARSGVGVAVNTLADLRALGFDAHGQNADPLLASASPTQVSDFMPAYASPVFGAGSNLNATVPSDYRGDTFTATPPIGALNLLSKSVTNGRGLAAGRVQVH